MKAATERKLLCWFHLIASVPILGYIYGPVAEKPEAAFVVKAIILPLVILSGLWLWQGHRIKKLFAGNGPVNSPRRQPPLKFKA